MHFEPSRRGFLKVAGSAAGTAWLAAYWPAVLAAAKQAGVARAAAAPLETLSAEEGADFSAIAAQIIPTDELPGATEAGVVYFIDAALRGFMAGAAADLRRGLAELNRKAAAAQSGARFAGLTADAQLRLLKQEEASPFFGTMQFLTVAGMFSLPGYGGNRDYAGFKMLGFEHRHFWVPPFGHYDAAARPGAKK
jgi:gluconate 2-dehydrogenase gamma chain